MLYFETASQANGFLCSVFIGFVTALFIDIACGNSVIRPVWDVMVMISSCLSLAVICVTTKHDFFRMYQLLGWLVGCILYCHGLRRIYFEVVRRMRRKNKTKQEKVPGVEK